MKLYMERVACLPIFMDYRTDMTDIPLCTKVAAFCTLNSSSFMAPQHAENPHMLMEHACSEAAVCAHSRGNKTASSVGRVVAHPTFCGTTSKIRHCV